MEGCLCATIPYSLKSLGISTYVSFLIIQQTYLPFLSISHGSSAAPRVTLLLLDGFIDYFLGRYLENLSLVS